MSNKRARPVIAGVASIPSRCHSLRLVIESIVGQVDQIEVVLNGYDVVPEWLNIPRVSVVTSQDAGDHADNAKFLGMQKYDDCIYFALDDDILYPNDYVVRMLDCLSRFGAGVAVGVHGAFVPESPVTFLSRRVFCFWDALAFDAPCSYLGTGTIAVMRKVMPASPLDLFTDKGMSDLFVAAHLKSKGIPAICVNRPKNWLKKIPTRGYPSLWERAQKNSGRQDAILTREAPWGVADLLSRCRGTVSGAISPDVRLALEASDAVVRGTQISDGLRARLSQRWKVVRDLARYYAGSNSRHFADLGLR